MFTALFSLVLSSMLFLSLHLESRTLPKPLTQKEEKEEFEKYHKGDNAARDRLIRHNLRLVAHVAKKYYANPQDNEDLISIGTIGLIKAVQSFNYEKNTRFSTYRAKCIENAILSQMRLWFQTSTLRAEKNPNGVFWHRFQRIYTYFVPLRTDM
ncbi:MAG: sigma-70 family RNA polymerase sigma factor [Oscillospiraceae bacterium]|nr:sigma-70 family RNA polymerase sigma factor [Oscillospiraceae bacterium]